jgi:hypothetical protein
MARFHRYWIDLSHRMAKFNISLARALALRDMMVLREPASPTSQRLKNKRKPTCG